MTKTIITIFISLYSLARLITIAALYYYEIMRLPLPVIATTIICCILCLIIAGSCYLRNLSGKNLRLGLFICAAAALSNMLITLLAQPGTLTTLELLITGTIFDPLFFIGSCTIKIRDTKGALGRTPFARMAKQKGNANATRGKR
ncbi:MAG: hypothetical protein RR528_06265 [Angelakisella sp.]